MIPFLLIYHKGKKSCRVPVRHYAVPSVGDRLIPPDGNEALTVLTVEHDLNDNKIYVVLS